MKNTLLTFILLVATTFSFGQSSSFKSGEYLKFQVSYGFIIVADSVIIKMQEQRIVF